MDLSPFIGLVVGVYTERVYGLNNPDRDEDLDLPLSVDSGGEPVVMLRIERGAYDMNMSVEDVETFITEYYARSSYVWDGEERMDRCGG